MPDPRKSLASHSILFLLIVSTSLVFSRSARAVYLQENKSIVSIAGNMTVWDTVTLSLNGPTTSEDAVPNPFLDYRFEVTFRFESEGKTIEHRVPGYFAADGDSANSSATSGNIWRAKFTPSQPGEWTYQIHFAEGKNASVSEKDKGDPLRPYDGHTGNFEIKDVTQDGFGFRSEGRLCYVRKHLLEFSKSGRAFFKVGPDSPETLLAYSDFDQTTARSPRNAPLKNWSPHIDDWRDGDPTWKDGKGKGLIGAINYLSESGLNSVSFLTYNVGGDGKNVWPHLLHSEKQRMDCSKLAQWAIVFEHAQDRNLLLHFKLQETENDDQRFGHLAKPKKVPAALDGGKLGIERKLYLRELVARFAHLPGIEWNLGEENTQSTEEQAAMAKYIQKLDSYNNSIVLHTYPDQQAKRYSPHLGEDSRLTGLSLQNDWRKTHRQTLDWVKRSADSGFPWVVANDEQGNAREGVPPDTGFEGFSGTVGAGSQTEYDLNDIRKSTLWGNLMAGGAGVMYYFGYSLPENDLNCQNFRSRQQSWNYCHIAKEFIRLESLPLNEMKNANRIVGNGNNERGPFCLRQNNELFLIYVPDENEVTVDLTQTPGEFAAYRFNPKSNDKSERLPGTQKGGQQLRFEKPENFDDWVILLRKTGT